MTSRRRLRVAMYTATDPDNDTRVLREADLLAAAGHEVVLIAHVRAENGVPADSSRPSGARLIRIARDPRWSSLRMRDRAWIRYPWRARREFASRVEADLRGGPARWRRAATSIGLGVLSLPWIAYRFAAWRLLGDRLPYPKPNGQIDYIITTRRSLEPWIMAAARTMPEADVHHGHDFPGLWAAVEASRIGRGRVVYDSHEYYPESGRHARQGIVARRWLRRRERALARRATALVTVNRTLEEVLRRSLGFTRSVVVHNAPPRWSPPDPPPDLLRNRLGLPRSTPVALYHGGLTEDRGLLPLTAAFAEPGIEAVHLVFMGSGPLRDTLYEHAGEARYHGRIHLIDPVPPDELAEWVASADVGLMPNLPVTANERLSTPNKLFESMAVGLPVVSSDFPERRRIILEDPLGPLGALCDPTSPASIAAAIRSIVELAPPERADLRGRILRAAHERWNWETEGARLEALYESLVDELPA
jgi:glycosyltransferase involved in cell wall biosynthesis